MDDKKVLFFKNGMPNYAAHTTEPLVFNAWYAPSPELVRYQELAACGFSHIFLMGHWVGENIRLDETNKPCFKEEMSKALALCEQVGVKAFVDVSDCALKGVDAESGKAAILSVLNEYAQSPAFVGLCYDEPVVYVNNLNKRWGIVDLAPVVEAMQEQYPQAEFMVNLNPSTNLHPGWFSDIGWGEPAYTYEEYFDAQVQYINSQYAETDVNNWLSVDDYPLYVNGEERYLKPTWLECVSYLAVRKRDEKMRLNTNFFIQSMPFERGANTRDRVPTYHDMRLQAYTLMAFGYDSISFFCYATPQPKGDFSEDQVALLDRNGNKTATYYDAQKLIGEIKQFSHTYMQFHRGWKGVYTVIGKNNALGTKPDFDNLARVGDGVTTKHMQSAVLSQEWLCKVGIECITATEDTLVGCMKDTWDNPAFMVVNYNETTHNKLDDVTIFFDTEKYDKAWVYIDGIQTEVAIPSGKLTLNLGVGEGVFVIPVKKA